MTERIRPTIESCEVVRLLPTFVWKAQLARETYEGINADVLRGLDKLTRDQPIAAGEVWQSGHGLNKLPGVSGLMDNYPSRR